MSGRSTAAASPETQVIGRLAVFDRLLPVWVLGAMALGIGLGRAVPSLNKHLNVIQVTSGTSLPIFVGLLVMMYPVLAKVRYGQLGSVTRDRQHALVLLRPQLGRRAGGHVRPGLAAAPRPTRLSDRTDHRRPGALHRHGPRLERPLRRGP